MIQDVVASLGLVAVGIVLIRTRHAAHAWYASSWRVGDTPSSWFAALLGPAGVATAHGLLGLAAIAAGIVIVFRAG